MKSNLLAAIKNPALPSNLQDLEGADFVNRLLSSLITTILVVASVLFVFMLLLGGVQWIMSGGDKTAAESARGKITAALIGLVVVFSVFAIVKAVELIFSVSILTIDIGALIIQ